MSVNLVYQNEQEFVDLAAMSMSGSLIPSVPVQIMLKYSPPKITIVYHFEKMTNQQFFHDILIEEQTLRTQSCEEIINDLYLRESYYFNPKQIKRPQLFKLVQRMKQNIGSNETSSPQRVQYQSPQTVNNNSALLNHSQGTPNIQIQENSVDSLQQQNKAPRKPNFFERKRFINQQQSMPEQERHDAQATEESDDNQDQSKTNNMQSQQQKAAIQQQHQSRFSNRFENKTAASSSGTRRRLQDAISQNSSPAQDQGSPDHKPKLNSIPMALPTGQSQLAPLKPPRGNLRQSPLQSVTPQQQPQNPTNQDNQQNQQENIYSDAQIQQTVQFNNGSQQSVLQNEYLQNADQQKQQQQQQNNQQENQYYDNNYQQQQNQESNDAYESNSNANGDDEENVYMIDNVVCRQIQIEGENQKFLMDPNGNIYDMDANFIGTTNAQQLPQSAYVNEGTNGA